MMFWHPVFEEMNIEAEPIWFFQTEDPYTCLFSIGEQFNYDPNRQGGCSIDETTMQANLTFAWDYTTNAQNVTYYFYLVNPEDP